MLMDDLKAITATDQDIEGKVEEVLKKNNINFDEVWQNDNMPESIRVIKDNDTIMNIFFNTSFDDNDNAIYSFKCYDTSENI
jgi:hypothetical protein